MATLRQLRTRVASISNIQRVTNAMYMVAAAKMRRAQDAIESARPYAEQIDATLRRIQGSVESDHPLFRQREVRRLSVVVVSSDRGLCGAFNGNVGRQARLELESQAGVDLELITVGRKGRDFLAGRGFEADRHYADVFRQLQFATAAQIARGLTADYAAERVDRALLVFSEFRSVASQVPVVRQLLPIAPPEDQESAGGAAIFEPGPEQLLEALMPRHVSFQVWRALLETNAGFFAAQMAAMDNATRNAGDLITELTREVNKERQSSITLELMDIIGGAEAVAQ